MKARRDVTARLTYLSPESDAPAYYSGEPGQEERSTGQYSQIPIEISDARALPRAPELDVEGFCLIKHGTQDVDFNSDDDVTTNYYPQIVSLLKQQLGADEVIVFDHNVRLDAKQAGIRRPARHVHSDYTVRSAIRRMLDLVDEKEAVGRLRHRFGQVNLWRPLKYQVSTSPLALADARSVKQEDYVKVDIIYPDRKGEILEVIHKPSHRWFYFPDMTPSEALIFKGFDSDPKSGYLRTPHSAFEDPTSPRGAKPRLSIELRAMVFF